MNRTREVVTVTIEVAVNRIDSCVAQLCLQSIVGVWRVQVAIDKSHCLRLGRHIAGKCPLVHLCERVMESSAVAESFMYRRVETVKKSQLELIRTFD